MRLTKIGTKEPVKEYKPSAITAGQKELFEWNMQGIIPYGKHKNLTVAEVAKIDPKYLKWIEDKGLVGEWGLNRLKSTTMKVQVSRPQYHITPEGEVWVGLREETNQKTTASIWL